MLKWGELTSTIEFTTDIHINDTTEFLYGIVVNKQNKPFYVEWSTLSTRILSTMTEYQIDTLEREILNDLICQTGIIT